MESKIIKSVFIVCENDNYGQDIYKGVFNTREEAERLENWDTTRRIYEHELYEYDEDE